MLFSARLPGLSTSFGKDTAGSEKEGHLSRPGRLFLPLAGILLLLTCVLAWQGPPFTWEIQLSSWIHRVQGPGVGWILRAVSWIGSGAVPFMLIPLLAFVLWKAGLPERAWVLLAGAGGASLTNLMRSLLEAPRSQSSSRPRGWEGGPGPEGGFSSDP